ncbi:MAG TPA: acyloxyacyl hydrolase [Dongiaceae bacterium]|nr:acyloxyacyl hydrolase [Dongiaceae bacterium]
MILSITGLSGNLHVRPLRLRPGVASISFLVARFLVLFLVGIAPAQEQPATSQLTTWFSGQFKNEHGLHTDTSNARLYQLEFRYSRLIHTSGPLEFRWVFDVVPMTLVGDPYTTSGHRRYAYGGGGSPFGAQVNWAHFGRVEPFVTLGGGALYFNKKLLEATHFNFNAQLGAGVQLFSSSRRHSFDVGCKYHHISNANLGDVNHGMDSLMLFVGTSFLR